jgi:hypothetical protein
MNRGAKGISKLQLFIRVLLGILLNLFWIPTSAEPLTKVTLLEESNQSLTLELTLAEPVISEKQLSGNTYQAIHIAGTGYTHESGKPQLPFQGALIAVPANSQLQLEIIESETEIRTGLLLPPALTFNPLDIEQPLYTVDASSYQTDHFQPASPVKIGLTGWLREQPVAQIQFFPVLHNPVQQTIKLYQRLRVKVHFSNHIRSITEPVVEESPAFARMLDHLLLNNTHHHEALRHSRSTRTTTCLTPPPRLKISIANTGVYALNYADFLALDLDISTLDAHHIQMNHQGQPVSIYLSGEPDGVFGLEDKLYFYAQAADGLYTRENVYWLTLNPEGGTRTQFKADTPNLTHPPLTEFTQTIHVEENKVYWSRMPDSTNQDRLFWKELHGGKSLEMPVKLHHIAQPAEPATIRVMMQGKSDDYAANPDHHTQILLNGVAIDEIQWNGQQVFLQEATIPQTELLEGKNTITLASLGTTEATVDILYVNWLEIDYTATMTALEDQLKFEVIGSGPSHFTVDGFSQPDLLVLDITNPLQIAVLPNLTVLADHAEGYQIQYSDQLEGNKTYYALPLVEEQLLKPANITMDSPPQRLKSPCHQVDYLLIYHDSFDVTELQTLIAARGVQVMTVPISDIYDEFNHGIADPQAIKDFLTYAYGNYTPPRPTYVLLVGDANRDTLNELGHGINYIPTYTFHTSEMGETPTDNWFVSVSGDDPLPDMFLGRIPIRTQAELDAVVNKLRRYPQAPLDGWQRNVLFVADNNSGFEDVSKRLIEQYLADYIPKQIYLREYQDDKEAITQDIIQAINIGAVVTNYTGHGSLNLWSGKDIFNHKDVALLNNPDKLTFAVALNCQNGLFSYSQPFRGTTDSLAEAFLKADGKGAIAMWAPSGLGYTDEHEILANELFRRLFQDNETELGSLTTLAKIAAITNYGISTDNLEMFTLFGDPNLQLRLE